jgi:hypothetical protein
MYIKFADLTASMPNQLSETALYGSRIHSFGIFLNSFPMDVAHDLENNR